MLTTTPFLRPLDGYAPNATISSLASLLNLPTIQTTLDVPMSKPTIKLEFFLLFAIIQCNSIFVSHIYNTRILSILEQIM